MMIRLSRIDVPNMSLNVPTECERIGKSIKASSPPFSWYDGTLKLLFHLINKFLHTYL